MTRLSGTFFPGNRPRDAFACAAVRQGGVIRRKRRDFGCFVGTEALAAEVRRRGFRGAEYSGRVAVFCNRAPVRFL